jgi:hypothetical protein
MLSSHGCGLNYLPWWLGIKPNWGFSRRKISGEITAKNKGLGK